VDFFPPTRWYTHNKEKKSEFFFLCLVLIPTAAFKIQILRFKRHPFLELVHSAGEQLRTPERFPSSMATVLLSVWTNIFSGIW